MNKPIKTVLIRVEQLGDVYLVSRIFADSTPRNINIDDWQVVERVSQLGFALAAVDEMIQAKLGDDPT